MTITKELIKNIKSQVSDLVNEDEADAIITHLLSNPFDDYPFCKSKTKKEIVKNLRALNNKMPEQNSGLRFIDLFAGIGGFHKAFESLGCQCVFASEWDSFAKETYFANYHLVPFGDIRKIEASNIPDHDILCAGFPCQPFSIAGISKKNSMGKATGFEDKTQGTLFFDVARVIKAKRPKAFFLENVKNLISHNRGKTWAIIRETLENELKYKVFVKVVDGQAWVPQHRERVFIVGFDATALNKDLLFDIPECPENDYKYKTLSAIICPEVDKKYTLTDGTWAALQHHKEKHLEKGNGFGYKLLPLPLQANTITSTISARYYKDGSEILVPQSQGRNPRRLTVTEAMQLQGFDPDSFVFPVSNVHAYKQIGNSVVVPAIKATAKEIIRVLSELEYK